MRHHGDSTHAAMNIVSLTSNEHRVTDGRGHTAQRSSRVTQPRTPALSNLGGVVTVVGDVSNVGDHFYQLTGSKALVALMALIG